MVSYSLVFRQGPANFIKSAVAAGFQGLIIPDLPLEEAEKLAPQAAAQKLGNHQLVTPTTPLERAKKIAATTTGFLYVVSVTGITGTRTSLPAELTQQLAQLRQLTKLPLCVGFGISTAEQAKMLAGAADGIIVGRHRSVPGRKCISYGQAQDLEHSGIATGGSYARQVVYLYMALIEQTDRGLYCAAGDFYIDPWRGVPRAIVTHAHSDHARRGSDSYLAPTDGVGVLRHRLGSDIKVTGLQYGDAIDINGVRVSLHPAGHILGACMVRVEHRGEVWLFSGDYKTQSDPTCKLIEPVSCDVFISECTFGLPIYRWQPSERVFQTSIAGGGTMLRMSGAV